jgi:hypothetical protein
MPFSHKLGAIVIAGAVVACSPSDNRANQNADTTARNLTLAPTESTTARGDTARAAPPAAAPTTPRRAPPAARPPAARPPAPVAPASYTLSTGTHIGMTMNDTITSRTAKAGDQFRARVATDVRDRNGRVVIPAGATVEGAVVEVKPAPNPQATGTMVLKVSSVSVGSNDYPINASIDSVATVMKGRGVTGKDAAKVGVGAAAGAVLGRIVGKNAKGAVIGGVVGGAVGAGVAANTKDVDIVVPAGARIVVTLTEPLTVRAS